MKSWALLRSMEPVTLCSRWMLYSKLGGDIADGIVLTCALVGLLGAVAVLLFSVTPIKT